MSAILIDGKKVSSVIIEEIKKETLKIEQQINKKPTLAVVLVGDDPASSVYVRSKEKRAKEVGFNSLVYRLDKNIEKQELFSLIESLNNNKDVDGVLVQLPLPKHIKEQEVIEYISPEKDVDGFHSYNLGKLLRGEETIYPCTPYGIIKLLEYYNISPKGKNVVVIGRSNIVGKPIAMMLANRGKMANATVSILHTKTKDMKLYTKQADIIIVATGVINTLTADMVKDGVIVIDVGINRVDAPELEKGYRLIGDVDFEGVKEKASYITPVPGGVGPMTIAMLLYNTLEIFKKRNNIK